jgi:exonuclease V gamma subunit
MSTLYLATDADRLAAQLVELLDRESQAADLFAPVTIVVPNRYLGQWLRLRLARQMGIAVNLRFLYLENALWELLRAVDPREHPSPPELLDHDHYRLMVLALLWEDGPELGPLRSYLTRDGHEGRNFWRRSWRLADRLARFIRDYEYHRQDALIQKWLKHELGYPEAAAIEKSQREIFERIVRLPDGKRALLEQATGKVLKTLPQYAMEVMEHVQGGQAGKPDLRGRMVHLVGITQISALHVKTLHWLSGHYDLRFYHLNPLATSARPGSKHELLSAWGQAGEESFKLLEILRKPPCAFDFEMIDGPETAAPPPTVLRVLQAGLRGRETQAVSLPQDTSLQIVACPGVYREVETVYNSILDNLQHSPDLKQTDVAVLVTDLAKYRPVLQAVFERQPRRLHYNLGTISAAGTSAFGQALLGSLDLALEAFTRSEVFAVLLNPCVLARLGVDRGQALTWLTWAEELGIYHGWDRRDKEERGYPATPLFSWRLGLQRLRLGRLMEVAPPEPDSPAPRFHGVIPYADLASSDKEQLDGFCRAVEGLLPALFNLRNFCGTGAKWAETIRKLVQQFLDVPEDRPEEAQVRDRLLRALPQLETLDRLQEGEGQPLPLPLVREFVLENLEALEGARGEVLTGGVTIAALAAVRPVPFRIIYILGLGEDLFPGANTLNTFDLRMHERLPGDIRPAETNRFLFLEVLLSARDKVYLLYNNRELQRDQELQPCVPLAQLRRHLRDRVCGGRFEIVKVPLSGGSTQYLEPPKPFSDVLVNFNETERMLALDEARRDGRLQLDLRQGREIDGRLDRARRKFEPPDVVPAVRSPVDADKFDTISISELKRFLLCPAEAALRRHLRLQDEEDIEIEDEEPFWTDSLKEYNLVVQSLETFVLRAVKGSVAEATAGWRERFVALYEEWRLRCQVPEGVFAELEQAKLVQKLEERLQGAGGVVEFLRRRPADTFAGPILVGESPVPVNARRRFPAVTLKVGPNLYVASELRLVGACRLAWRSKNAFEILVLTNKSEFSDQELSKPILEPVLFALALRAGEEQGCAGISSAEWLDRLPVHIHVAHAGGIARFTYQPRDLTPGQSREYLTALAVDFLNSTCYDLLPFELIVKNPELRAAYRTAAEDMRRIDKTYLDTLRDLFELDQESDHPAYRPGRLMEVVSAEPPADACAKVRRRFELLDRGPEHNRQAKKRAREDKKENKGARVRSGPARGR